MRSWHWNNASHWARALGLGVLLAMTAARADHESCEMRCSSKDQEGLQNCMSACPAPGDVSSKKMDSFRNCASRCTAKFQEQFKACSDSCPKPPDGQGPRKAKSVRAARSRK
ncbi:hypothetical protein [Corallococcus exercitus]|uniref:hypothetical protein n=1 Tax=Corallococcus exercitus TaxID=2316736 RepID=UPI0035D40B21